MSAERRPSITIVGAGVVGTHLLDGLLRAGHRVGLAARDAASPKVRGAVEQFDVEVVPLASAADDTDVVILAVPYAAVVQTVEAITDLGDTILVDATNTVGGSLPSGAATIVDVIADAAPDATIVKAFNTIGAEALTDPTIAGHPLFLPIAGDRPAADLVAGLATDLGFDAIVIGDRSAVHLLESHAALWIHLAFAVGVGRDLGFARLRRADHPEAGQ